MVAAAASSDRGRNCCCYSVTLAGLEPLDLASRPSRHYSTNSELIWTRERKLVDHRSVDCSSECRSHKSDTAVAVVVVEVEVAVAAAVAALLTLSAFVVDRVH